MKIAITDQITMSLKKPSIDSRFGPYNSISEAYAAVGPEGYGKTIAGMPFGIVEDDGSITTYRWTVTDGTEEDYERADFKVVHFGGVQDNDVSVQQTSSTNAATSSEVLYIKARDVFCYRYGMLYYINWKNRYRWEDSNLVPYDDVLYLDESSNALYYHTTEGLVLLSQSIEKVSELENDANYVTEDDVKKISVDTMNMTASQKNSLNSGATSSLMGELTRLKNLNISFENDTLYIFDSATGETKSYTLGTPVTYTYGTPTLEFEYPTTVGVNGDVLNLTSFEVTQTVTGSDSSSETLTFNSLAELVAAGGSFGITLDSEYDTFSVNEQTGAITVEPNSVETDKTAVVTITVSINGKSVTADSDTITQDAAAAGGDDEAMISLGYFNGCSSSMGTLSGDGSVGIGVSTTVNAYPETGYTFAGWYSSVNSGLVSTEASYTFVPLADTTLYAKFVEASVESDVTVTVLGKYHVKSTFTQNGTASSTTSGYTSTNGVEISAKTGSATLSNSVDSYAGTVLGWKMNGTAVTSPVTLAQDSVITPNVEDSLIYATFSGVYSSSLKVQSDSVHLRTNIFPVVKNQNLVITIPNHESETVKIRSWACHRDMSYNEANSTLLSITLDENGKGTITPQLTGWMALHFSYASDYTATVFSQEDIKKTKLSYACTKTMNIPAFFYKQVADLGAVGTSSWNNTWNQSAALYNGYMVTVSTTARRFLVFDTATERVVGTVVNDNYISDMHPNSACFLSVKYNENDYYPLLLVCGHNSSTAPDYLYVLRLAGTTATSFTVSRVCTWTFTNTIYLDVASRGNYLYLHVRKPSSLDTPAAGLYRIAMNQTDSAFLTDKVVDIDALVSDNKAVYVNDLWVKTGQDHTVVTQTGQDDMIAIQYGPISGTGNVGNLSGVVFTRTSGIANGGNLIGYLPINRILPNYEPDGIVYVGNGVFYMVLVVSSHAYMYKFVMELPDDTE